jgi:hypothetical protein
MSGQGKVEVAGWGKLGGWWTEGTSQEPTVTRAQVMAAAQALGLDPEEVERIDIRPEYVHVTGRPGTLPVLMWVQE